MATAQDSEASLAEASLLFEQQNIYEGLLREDQTSWSKLYEYINPKLMSYFSNKGFSDSDCEDLSQETLLRAFARLSTYDPAQKPLDHWIYGIAKNVWLQRLRDDEEKNKYGLKGDIDDYADVAADDQLLDAQDESGRSLREVLQISLAKLSDEDQHIIELRLGRDKKLTTWSTLASELGISVSAAKMRYSRAIERLREAIATMMGPPDS